MQTSTFFRFAFALSLLLSNLPKASAEMSESLLKTGQQQNSTEFNQGVPAFVTAITHSLMGSQSRIKLPGAGNFYLETGFLSHDVGDGAIAPFTDNGHCPTSFQAITAKAGLGLPWGFTAQVGVSQVISEHRLTGLAGSLSYQLFDFSTWVSSNLVPAMTIDASGSRSISGPAEYSITGQTNFGVYHRSWLTQFSYAFRYNLSILTATPKQVTETTFQHGFISQVPLYAKSFLRMEVFFPTTSGAVILGYQF